MATAYPGTWEGGLVRLANQARHSAAPGTRAAVLDTALLTQAYAHCDRLIAERGKTFYLATRLLPIPKRRAIRTLYAFCRVTDDIVDCPQHDPKLELPRWRQCVLAGPPPDDDLVATAWTHIRRHYHVPDGYAEQLIDGVARDLGQQRYRTFADLTAYAYGVASTVGLMSLRIIGTAPGCSEDAATPYLIKLGVALQLTNILRDVGEDWRTGRVYLPTEELAAFGLTDADLAGGQVDGRWRAFMRFQIARTRTLYQAAWPGIAMFHPDGRFAVAAAAALYRAILDDIAAHDYDVFQRRAHVNTWGKLRRLPGIWWRNH
jgi:phytoene synthase